MLKLEIDCLFALGDYVEFSKEKSQWKVIDCPFCHGKKYYNFETKEFGDYAYLESKMTKANLDGSRTSRTFEVIKCKTCDSRGQVCYTTGYEVKFYRGTVKRVQALHSTGWRDFEFIVEEENTKKKVVVRGSELRKINKEEAINNALS